MSWSSVRVFIAMLTCLYQASVDASDIVCSNNCPIIHPQQHFCNADAALKLKVIDSSYIDYNHVEAYATDSVYVRYEAEVIVPLKGAQGVQPGSTVYFYSPTSGFTCTISSLVPQEIYLIAGKVQDGLLVVTDCDGLAMKWNDLTQTERTGVKGEYLNYCDTCWIKPAGTTKYIGGEKAEAGLESGYWSSEQCFYNPIPSLRYGGEDCETLYSTCAPDGSEGDAPCSWMLTEEYLDCAERRESTWFFMVKAEPAFTCRSQCRAMSKKNPLKRKCIKQIKKLEKLGHPSC